jgi:hypothetical protein
MSNIATPRFPFTYTGASSITTTAKTTYTTSSMPGAWLYSTTGSIPIYNSISDLSANQYKFNNSAAYIRVLTGYKVIHYTSNNFGGTSTTVDFTNNSYQLFTTATNILSLRLYYQGVEVKNNNIPINIPYSITNSNNSNTIDKTGLLYYYPFDTDIVNYSSASDGNTYELSSATLSTSTTKLTSGSLSIASGGHFRVPTHYINPSTGYSIALWYKLGTKTGTWSRIFDFSRMLNGPGDGIILGYPNLGSNLLRFSSANGGLGDIDTNYTMDTNWHHVCVTCSIGGYWTVYIDAVEVSMENRKIFPTVSKLNYCYINKSVYADGTASCNINQLLIFNREIKPYEVYYLYQTPTTVQLGYMQSQISNASLQYYYPLKGNFNDISNSTFTEGGINNSVNNGVISSSSLYLNGGSTTNFSIPSHYIGNNYSFSFHFKINEYPKRSFANIVNIRPGSNTNEGFNLYFSGYNVDVDKLQFIVNGAPFGAEYSMALNTWVNICVTYNTTNNEWKLYFNAILTKTQARAISSSLMQNWNFALPGANSSLSNDPNTITTLNCNVKQLAIFSKTLSLSEIQTLQNRNIPITLSNVMYYYPFETDFFDYSKTTYPPVGTDNSTHTNVTIDTKINTLPLDNGTYTNGVIATTPNQMTNGSISINSTRFFQVPSHYIPTNYSIALWVYLNSYSSGNWSRILDFGAAIDGAAAGGPILFFQNMNTGSLGFTPAGGVINTNVYDLKTLLINTWYHVCITYNGTTWTVYVDGLSIHTRNYTASTTLLQYCYIGRSTYTADSTTNCNVNQLAIFNQCLTVDQITTLRSNPNKYIRLTNLMYYYPFDGDFYDYSKMNTNIPSANINSSVGWIQTPSHYINPTGYSISLWYKLNSYAVGSGARVFDLYHNDIEYPVGLI